jgi:hypothetical protein
VKTQRGGQQSGFLRAPVFCGSCGLLLFPTLQRGHVVGRLPLMPDQTPIAAPTVTLAAAEPLTWSDSCRIDVAAMATRSADHDENLIALRNDADVHSERVTRTRRVVHEAPPTTGYATVRNSEGWRRRRSGCRESECWGGWLAAGRSVSPFGIWRPQCRSSNRSLIPELRIGLVRQALRRVRWAE